MNFFRRKWSSLQEWWRFTTEMNRDLVKTLAWVLAAAAAAGAVWFAGRPFFKTWRQDRALVQVEEFAGSNARRSALLALRRATEIDPNDIRVWREAAGFLAEIGSPEAIVAGQNVSHPAPDDISLRIALVAEALRFGDPATARTGVGVLEQASRQDAGFYRLAAAVSLAMGRSEELERRLVSLVATDPMDPASRFNLAAIRLWSADEEASRKAHADLVELGAEPSIRVRSSLERLKFAAATREPARVDAEVGALVPLLNPRLAGIPLKRDTPNEPPGWESLLQGLQTIAATNPGDATLVLMWLNDLGLGPRALAWLDTLPTSVRADSQLAAAEADIAARTNDLPRLADRLANDAWGRIPAETVSLALASRIQQTRFGEQRARQTWDDAIATTANSLAGLRMLARLGGIWRDGEGTERALRVIVEKYPGEHWACEALRFRYAARGDLEKLWQLHQVWAPRSPDNLSVQQTWIMLGVLLKKSAPLLLERATELHEAHPDDVPDALAYIGSQWTARNLTEAAEVLAKLPESARNEPRVILWVAIIAAEQNREDDLKTALAALPRKNLLREEQQLLDSILDARDRRKTAAQRAEAAKKAQPAKPAEKPGDKPAADQPAAEKPAPASAPAPGQTPAPESEPAAQS